MIGIKTICECLTRREKDTLLNLDNGNVNSRRIYFKVLMTAHMDKIITAMTDDEVNKFYEEIKK